MHRLVIKVGPHGAVHIADVHAWADRLAASAQVREVEPKYFDDVLHPDDPRRSDYAKPAAEPVPATINSQEIDSKLIVEPVPVAQHPLIQRLQFIRMIVGGQSDDTIVEAIATIADHARIVADLESKLAECFRLAGGDTECFPIAQQAARAVSVVADLRECYDERGDELTALEASLAACRAQESSLLLAYADRIEKAEPYLRNSTMLKWCQDIAADMRADAVTQVGTK
jgi:hypothetical protein